MPATDTDPIPKPPSPKDMMNNKYHGLLDGLKSIGMTILPSDSRDEVARVYEDGILDGFEELTLSGKERGNAVAKPFEQGVLKEQETPQIDPYLKKQLDDFRSSGISQNEWADKKRTQVKEKDSDYYKKLEDAAQRKVDMLVRSRSEFEPMTADEIRTCIESYMLGTSLIHEFVGQQAEARTNAEAGIITI